MGKTEKYVVFLLSGDKAVEKAERHTVKVSLQLHHVTHQHNDL